MDIYGLQAARFIADRQGHLIVVKLPDWLCVRGIDTDFTLVENIGGAAGKDFDLYVFFVHGLVGCF